MIFRRALPLGPALRDRLGRPGRLRAIASSLRSRVWRAEFAGTPAVVKQIVGDPDAAARYDRELTALRLAGAARLSCPRCSPPAGTAGCWRSNTSPR